MTKRHTRQVVTTTRFGRKRIRTVQVKGHRHDFAKPHALRPQVHRAGRNAKRGYRHGRRGHTWRRDGLYALAVIEFVIWFGWGATAALGFAITVLGVIGLRLGYEARDAHRRRTARRTT